MEITRDEFIERFKLKLRELLCEHYDVGYANDIAPTYWEDAGQRSWGPEECAEAEFSEWGEE